MTTPDRAELRAFGQRLHAGTGGVFHFPIRHHSPACALHLARALAELQPRTVVIEMPADFAPVVPLVLDPATRTPVAVVAVARPGKGDRPAVMGYWPLSATAPELTAMRTAAAAGARIVLADLPAGARLRPPPDEPEEAPAAAPPPVLLTDEQPLAYSAYARNVVARLGARDFNEAWDRLFESRTAEKDWRGFFADLGVHCLLSRLATPNAEMEADGTLIREAFMRHTLAQAVATGPGPVAVVTGGFHTPALLDGDGTDAPAGNVPAVSAYLVRYGERNLDRVNGYGAGMPSPRFYEHLHAAVAGGEPHPFDAVATTVLQGMAERLRREQPGLAPPLPALIAALEQARGLAELRGLAGPGRSEVLDAARSCFLKGEDPRFGSPLMDALHRELTGDAIGNVPRSAGSPPLVEAVRARARALGFKVEDGQERRRELDLHRKDRHRAASRFLHAMQLLGTGFGQYVQGPDWTGGVQIGLLFEVWTCAWSPQVEGRLVSLSAEGDTLDAVVTTVLLQRASALEEEGKGRNADEAARLVLIAAQAGAGAAQAGLLAALGESVAADPDFARIVGCFGTLDGLWRGRHVLGLAGSPALGELRAAAYRRAVDLLPDLPTVALERAEEAARALAGLHHLLDVPADQAAPSDDRSLFDEGVAALLDGTLPPLITGVVGALGVLSGHLPAAGLAERVCGALAGPAVDPADRVAPLAGLLLVQPALLRRCEPLLAGLDGVFAGMEEDAFLSVLPHLRMALAALDPHETDDLADRVAVLTGLNGPLLFFTGELTEHEVLYNAEQAHALGALLAADGLEAWFPDVPA